MCMILFVPLRLIILIPQYSVVITTSRFLERHDIEDNDACLGPACVVTVTADKGPSLWAAISNAFAAVLT